MSSLTAVKYENLIDIGSHSIGNVNNYDYYISATVNVQDSFTPELLNTFIVTPCVAFFGLNDTIPNDLPISVFKKHLSSVRSENTVNLDFYTSNFNNIFLRIDVNGDEIEWLNYVSIEKLNKIKQLVITLNPFDNEVGLQKLSNTHYPIHVASKEEKVVVTYLRKEFVTITAEEPVVAEEVVVVEEPLVVEEPVVVEEPIVVEEPAVIVVEEPAVEEPAVIVVVDEVVEEEQVVVEESVVVEEPIEAAEEPAPVEEEEPVVEASAAEEETSEDSTEEAIVDETSPVEEPIIKEGKKKGRPRKQK